MNAIHKIHQLQIGAFDSGIGGFSILKEVHRLMPALKIDYLADDAFAPYGTKTREQIIERSLFNTSHLLERGAHLILVACNSATAVAIEELRVKFPTIPFVGVEPYLNALHHPDIFPGIKRAGVITTVLTGKSEKFQNLKKKLDPDNTITHWPLANLAGLIEDLYHFGFSDSLDQRIKSELSELKNQQLTHLILGCTHYPLIALLIEKYLEVKTISPCPYVALRVESLLKQFYSDAYIHLNQMVPENTFLFSSTKAGVLNQQNLFSSLELKC